MFTLATLFACNTDERSPSNAYVLEKNKVITSEASQSFLSDTPQSTPVVTDTNSQILMEEPTSTLNSVLADSESDVPVVEFTFIPTLCTDEHGPDCTKLRLGDDYLSTTKPASGYLYSCRGKNPNAPGSIESKITWINFADKTWNLLNKLWLPSGAFKPQDGAYTETDFSDLRQITTNNLPTDNKIGDWPMTNYLELTSIDRNPGVPAPGNFEFTFPTHPLIAPSPTCVPLGAIGVAKNGVVIYNAADGRGEDAVAREIIDMFGGHPARSEYHYHFIPERLDSTYLSTGHSDIVGFINDGFPIYGYKGNGGFEMSNDDLDRCHGHNHGELGYHYHATIEYPYTVGCYMGLPVQNDTNRTSNPG